MNALYELVKKGDVNVDLQVINNLAKEHKITFPC